MSESEGFTATAFGEGSVGAPVMSSGATDEVGVNLEVSHPFGEGALLLSPDEAEQAARLLLRQARRARKRGEGLARARAFREAQERFCDSALALSRAWEELDASACEGSPEAAAMEAAAGEEYPQRWGSFTELAHEAAGWRIKS